VDLVVVQAVVAVAVDLLLTALRGVAVVEQADLL
jgi:hypothetical protein